MEKTRVKYYSNRDLSIGFMLGLAEGYLDRANFDFVITDVNEALEVLNVNKLIDTGIKLDDWNNDRHRELANKSKRLKAKLGRFCSTINDSTLVSYFEAVETGYHEDFFDLLETYNVIEHISDDAFKNLLVVSKSNLYHIIMHRKIVNAFDSVIADYMVNNGAGAELLIAHYYSAENYARKYHIPKSLMDNQKKEIITKYINSEEVNTNYLSLIIQPIDDTGLRLDDKTRFLAQKRRDEKIQELLSGQSGLTFGAEICFDNCDEDSIDTTNPLIPRFVYSKNWIENNRDYPTLLNNLIHMFGLVDGQHRCTFVSKKNNLGVIEKHLGIRSKREYLTGVAFSQSQCIQILNLTAYDKVLRELNIDFEDIIRWFFEDYLQEEFGVEGFVFKPSDPNASFTQRCRNILCELDSLLKQFKLYAEDGEINRGLLEFSSTPVMIEEIPSILPEKYGYLNNDEIKQVVELLFSDQTMLGYTERTGSKYNNLVELISHEKVILDDYAAFQLNGIQLLIDREIIESDASGLLTIDREKEIVLKDFYDNEVVNVAVMNKRYKYLQELICDEVVQVQNTLFSIPEQDYIDFILNRHRFSNGLDLRNRYIHGTNPLKDTPEDYYRILLIISLLTIKINEEFSLREERAMKTISK